MYKGEKWKRAVVFVNEERNGWKKSGGFWECREGGKEILVERKWIGDRGVGCWW